MACIFSWTGIFLECCNPSSKTHPTKVTEEKTISDNNKIAIHMHFCSFWCSIYDTKDTLVMWNQWHVQSQNVYHRSCSFNMLQAHEKFSLWLWRRVPLNLFWEENTQRRKKTKLRKDYNVLLIIVFNFKNSRCNQRMYKIIYPPLSLS